MSLIKRHWKRFEVWVILGACVGMTIWYAKPQIIYSLYFTYQIARILFPGIVPEIDQY